MKSLFRDIRKKLLGEGKLVHYLSYAAGEVLLIVVGILFALNVNNWNSDRKAQGEYDLYIAQLKTDVLRAIENVKENIDLMERFQERCEFVPVFLELPEYGPEELSKFEAGLIALGSYSEAQVYVGLLGDLMNGNKDIIRRNRDLAQKALEMESVVKLQLNNLGHIYNQIDLNASRTNQFRGKGNRNVAPKYNLEKLKNSDEFVYISQSIASRLRTSVQFSNSIARSLEEFLAVLEEESSS